MLFTKTTLTTMDFDSIGERIEQQLHDHRDKYILEGVLFIVCGILAAAMPSIMALNVALLIGVVLLVTGVLQLVLTVKAKTHWWSLLSALLSILCGLFVLWKPLAMLLAIVTLMAVFLTVEGIFEILLSYQFRMIRNWGWMFFSGLITLGLAVILWIGYPTIGVLYLGWVIAINFILYGTSLLMLVWRLTAKS
jgi:uncharacterized membrane protein HdeD (DUF308 family)